MKNKAIIHIITGDGKGKTTASLGLALRAIGANKKVKIIQFMKKPIFSEHKAIKKYNLPIEIEAYGIGFYKILGDKHTQKEHELSCQKALDATQKAIESQKYDLLILDEINVAMSLKLIDETKAINIIKRATNCDIVLTGRNAAKKMIALADLVSVIKKEKHYFDQGLGGRKGIEF